MKLSYVEFDYWEGCRTGKAECKPLTFERPNNVEKWDLIMPCGGTAIPVALSEQHGIPKEKDIIQKEEISHSECSPIFELTNLKEGK